MRATPAAGNGQVEFDYSCRFIPPGNGSNHGSAMHISDPGPAEIVFDLDDRSGLHLRFLNDPAEAIWIAAGTDCPAGPGDGNGQFSVDRVQNMRLTLMDHHTDRAEYCYALRFDSDAGVKAYDPIIRN